MSRKAELAKLLRDYPLPLTKSPVEVQAERGDILQEMRECDDPNHYPIYPRKLPWEERLENAD